MPPATVRASEPRRVLRFRRSERTVHWSIAIPFLVCYTTALVLVVVYNPNPLRPYREIFSWSHRISGACLIVFPLLAVLKHAGDIRVHLYNIRQAWVWIADDVKWLMLMGLAALTRRISLPEQGKFNAGQKLNFMIVMSTYPLYIVTGLAMWISGAALLPWLVHLFMAIVATPFLLGHIFMATIPSSSRKALQGMVSGFVDRQWAKHHHSRWYRENFESKGTAKAGDPVAPRPQGTNGSERTVFPDPLRQIDHARRRFAREPNVAIAMLDGVRAANPSALRQSLAQNDGEGDSGIQFGREALELSAWLGNAVLAADLFRALWPNVRNLRIGQGEMRAIIDAFMKGGDHTSAVRACAIQIVEHSSDPMAINCLLKIAEIALYRKRSPRDAEKIYAFLLSRCADSPLVGYFRKGEEEARLAVLSTTRDGPSARDIST